MRDTSSLPICIVSAFSAIGATLLYEVCGSENTSQSCPAVQQIAKYVASLQVRQVWLVDAHDNVLNLIFGQRGDAVSSFYHHFRYIWQREVGFLRGCLVLIAIPEE